MWPRPNVGQTLRLNGAGLLNTDRVEFLTSDSNGFFRLSSFAPLFVASDGSYLDVTVPTNAISGPVRVVGSAGGSFLQVVPTLVDIDQGLNDRFFDGGLRLRGTAFVEGASTVHFNGSSFVDRSTSTEQFNVGRLFAHEGDGLDVLVPTGASTGPIRVSTLGGTSNTLGLELRSLEGVADSGTPATAGLASRTRVKRFVCWVWALMRRRTLCSRFWMATARRISA